jgi:hypothetical protein
MINWFPINPGDKVTTVFLAGMIEELVFLHHDDGANKRGKKANPSRRAL